MYGGHGGPQSASRGAAEGRERATSVFVVILFRLEEVLKTGGAYKVRLSRGFLSHLGDVGNIVDGWREPFQVDRS